jgi:hypothetical protein
MDSRSPYTGPERRRRKVFVTRNTEYHFLDQTCVAVRNRDTEQWRVAHVALRLTLSGSVSFGPDGAVQPKSDVPAVGDALFFATDGADVITSALTAVERPLPQTVEAYPI